MSEAAEFLNAIFAGYDGDIPFDVDGAAAYGGDREFLETNLGRLRVGPMTDAGACFVFGVLEDAQLGDVVSCRLQPTAVLKNGTTLIFVWAFESPVDDQFLSILTDALGMASPEEFIPVPGTDGWELLETTPIIYPFRDVYDAYAVEPAETAPADDLPPWDAPKYGDADVLAPYVETEHSNEIIITVGPNRESIKWKPMAMPAGAFIAKLCRHIEGPKDGPAFVLGDMVPGRRFGTAVKALYGVGLDIDIGTPRHVIDNALAKLGCLAIRYSTHSAYKTKTEIKKDKVAKFAGDREIDGDLIRAFLLEVEQWDKALAANAEYIGTEHTEKGIVCVIEHAKMPKHRVVALFKEPFFIEKEGPTQAEAMKNWKKVPEAFAGLLGVPFDTTGTDPSRLFYFPRHTQGRPFDISLFGGPYFDWRSLDLGGSAIERVVADLGKGKSKSVTDEGRALGRWSLKRSHGFQIADVVEQFASDRIRHNTGHGLEIECPFDEDHTNSGDQEDRACLIVNAGEGPSEWFTISCRHQGCRDKTNLDMLGKMIKDGWFEKTVLEDEQFNAIIEENEKPAVQVKIEKQDDAKKNYNDAIAELNEKSTSEEVDVVIRTVLEAGLTKLDSTRATKKIAKKIDANIDAVRNEIARVRDELEETTKERELNGRTIFRYKNEFHFDDAYMVCVQTLKKANRKAGEVTETKKRHALFETLDTTDMRAPLYSCMDSEPVRLMSKTDEGKTVVSFNTIGPTTLWAELNELLTFVKTGDQGDGARGPVPEQVAKQVYEQAYRSLPQAPEVIYTPLFLSDGTMLAKDGYHYDDHNPEYLNLLLVSNGLIGEMPPVPTSPSADEVEEAVDWIVTELLSDFPFLDTDSEGNWRREPSLANALAMLLTPFMRRMINGRTPVFFIYKPQPGTGGTLLGQLPMWLFDGAAGSATRYSQNEEEMQKGLIAAVQEPRSHLFFDDVRDFNNRELLRAITQANVAGRLLGSSKNIAVPNRFNWIATGNNTVILDEMRRRTVFIRLNARIPDATERVFRHPDISKVGYTEFVEQNRPLAVKHILTMIQYWISMGKEPFTLRRRASFEDWSAKVGGVLQACGVEGFLDNFAVVSTDLDDAANRQFIKEFHKKYGIDSVQGANTLFDWSLDTQLSILTGSNEDQKRTRFMKTSIVSMIDRTYSIGPDNFMFQQTVDDEQNIGFQLVKLAHESDETRVAA